MFMVTLLQPILLATCLLGAPCGPECGGSFLYQPAYCLDDALRLPAEEYRPQPGDILLTTDRRCFWNITFIMAFAGHPHHSGIVFQRPDGTMALLESGPHDTLFVAILDVLPHLKSYDDEGPVWIRRRRVPLTEEQSCKLTQWALRQDKKRFALVRLGGQLTPLRHRGPLRTRFTGKPHGDRRSYFCSELLMESCVAAGLLDPETTRPSATYPRDVFFDRSLNPYINKTLKLDPCWHPPARWTSCPAKQ